jgi:hypothetical protein
MSGAASVLTDQQAVAMAVPTVIANVEKAAVKKGFRSIKRTRGFTTQKCNGLSHGVQKCVLAYLNPGVKIAFIV